MTTALWISVGSFVLWGLVAAVALATRRVRRRFMIVQGIGLLVGAVVATTGTPPRAAAPAGLVIGTGVCVALWWFVRHGVNFELMSEKTYWEDEGRTPPVEAVSISLVAAAFIAGLVAITVN